MGVGPGVPRDDGDEPEAQADYGLPLADGGAVVAAGNDDIRLPVAILDEDPSVFHAGYLQAKNPGEPGVTRLVYHYNHQLVSSFIPTFALLLKADGYSGAVELSSYSRSRNFSGCIVIDCAVGKAAEVDAHLRGALKASVPAPLCYKKKEA
ncbi:MAG: hypothetical protein WCT36_06145 [Candidatus Gracilibacteria bacterium]|jgi:hypothetical protein